MDPLRASKGGLFASASIREADQPVFTLTESQA